MKKQTVVKRFISLVLGLVMVLGLAIPVVGLATPVTGGQEKSFEFDGFTIAVDGFLRETSETVRSYGGTLHEVIPSVYWITHDTTITVTGPAVAEWIMSATIELAASGFMPGFFGISNYGPNPNPNYASDWMGWDWTQWGPDRIEQPDTVIFERLPWLGILEHNSHIVAFEFRGQTLYLAYSEQPQSSATPPTTAPNLSTASTWAHDGINQAFRLGLIPQPLQNNYTANTTRAEFAALAVSLYETVTGREITGRVQFNDTNDINVQKMGYLGVVTGVGGGNFAPNNSLTREQAAVMLARLADVIDQPIPSSTPTFADNNQISSWAVDAVGQMQATGIMGGVGNNNFAPQGDYTREQSIITILRLFDLLQ